MSVVAESALELQLASNAQVLCNYEVNKTCRFTTDCGSACILNQLAPRAAALNRATVEEAGREIINHGRSIRHVVIAGKEPLETPERIFPFLRAYHEQPPDLRPAAVGLLTSGINLERHLETFGRYPLSWCIVSVDTEASGLRSSRSSQKSQILQTLTELRTCGGAPLIGVNSVVPMGADAGLMALAEDIEAAGIDQWALSPLLVARRGAMKPTLPAPLLAQQLERIAKRLASLHTVVSLDVDADTFERLSGGIPVQRDQWRTTLSLVGNVRMTAKNPDPGFFFRLRFDGQLLSHDEFMEIGLTQGAFGAYGEGRIAALMDHLAHLRNQRVAA